MKAKNNLAQFLDFANHRATSTKKQIKDLCFKVKKYNFNSAFVNSCWVKTARKFMGTKGKVGTVVSFPLGQDAAETKVKAVLQAIANGADEIDTSANVGLLKEKNYDKYLEELKQITSQAKKLRHDIIIKFIIEAYFLTPAEIKQASLLVLQSGADFVKTTSGFGPRDAKLEYVRIIKKAVGDKIRIKAAGGISTASQVKEYLRAGANRIGTSKAIEIVSENENNY